jgi:hypothetical protein
MLAFAGKMNYFFAWPVYYTPQYAPAEWFDSIALNPLPKRSPSQLPVNHGDTQFFCPAGLYKNSFYSGKSP